MEQMYYIAHRNLQGSHSPPRHPSMSTAQESCNVDPSEEFEIQVLDEIGRAVEITYLSATDMSARNVPKGVPEPVFTAVARLPKGSGIHVDAEGRETSLF